ncbi:hypothetical protein CRE_17571 [Caenorhabditis remanei]|uniref:Uncharacterized protein n=1 Tax=Caenorhabditis remanei TaxID=31234 RepID=E3NF39_CAERE|nr:hypothetical protein CRE_17571 [Caenorhabditis remanei]
MDKLPSIDTFSYEAIQLRQNGQGPLPQSRPNVATVSSTRPEGRPRVATIGPTRPDGQPTVAVMFHQIIPRAFQCSSCDMRFSSDRELKIHAESH